VTLRKVRTDSEARSVGVAAARWGGARKGFWLEFAVVVIKPLSLLLTSRDWRGRQHVPRSGGVILAVNHVSHVDPLLLAHFVYGCGRLPRFLAKIEVFRLPLVGRVVRGAGQIPVLRHTPDAAHALSAAVEALERGECLVIYPEGTITEDPQMWPMRARTGVARLALMTGAPVIPVAQWGAQDIFGRDRRVRLLPRRRIRFLAGPPVDLTPWQAPRRKAAATSEGDVDTLRAVTEAIMARIAEQLAEFRGEPPPAQIWDPAAQAHVLRRSA
jgi:1-acyl-sn-glycerol-3-phosphate acyltransferase